MADSCAADDGFSGISEGCSHFWIRRGYYNPSVNSLRIVEDFSQTVQVQKHLPLRRIRKSTFSNFNNLSRLDRQQGSAAHSEDSLSELAQQTIAVDGTFLPALADVVWAVRNTNNHGAESCWARIDCQLNVVTRLAEGMATASVKVSGN